MDGLVRQWLIRSWPKAGLANRISARSAGKSLPATVRAGFAAGALDAHFGAADRTGANPVGEFGTVGLTPFLASGVLAFLGLGFGIGVATSAPPTPGVVAGGKEQLGAGGALNDPAAPDRRDGVAQNPEGFNPLEAHPRGARRGCGAPGLNPVGFGLRTAVLTGFFDLDPLRHWMSRPPTAKLLGHLNG